MDLIIEKFNNHNKEYYKEIIDIIEEIGHKEIGFPRTYIDSYKKGIQENIYIIFIAKIKEKIRGVFVGTYPEGGVGTILWLLVKTKYRGQKIGRKLFNVACDRYKKMGCHKLKLTAPNVKAVKFYIAQGMDIEGFHPRHWWEMDFWSMGKFLN